MGVSDIDNQPLHFYLPLCYRFYPSIALCSFQLNTGTRVYYLSVENTEEGKHWFKTLQEWLAYSKLFGPENTVATLRRIRDNGLRIKIMKQIVQAKSNYTSSQSSQSNSNSNNSSSSNSNSYSNSPSSSPQSSSGSKIIGMRREVYRKSVEIQQLHIPCPQDIQVALKDGSIR